MQAQEKGGTVDACTCVAFLGLRQTCFHDIKAFVFALALVLASLVKTDLKIWFSRATQEQAQASCV